MERKLLFLLLLLLLVSFVEGTRLSSPSRCSTSERLDSYYWSSTRSMKGRRRRPLKAAIGGFKGR